MTSAEIITALQLCQANGDCSKCPYNIKLNTDRDCVTELHYDACNLFITLKIENISLKIYNTITEGINEQQ